MCDIFKARFIEEEEKITSFTMRTIMKYQKQSQLLYTSVYK